MRYLMIHYIDESIMWDENGDEIEDAEDQAALDAWDAEMTARGILVGGAVLGRVRDTTTIRTGASGLLVSDGPYAETKEQIAGYAVLECESLDQAVEVSSWHPTAKIGTFELRPIIG
jgi:hypothetical protein